MYRIKPTTTATYRIQKDNHHSGILQGFSISRGSFFVNCVSDLMAENNLQNTTFTNYNKALHSGNSFESFSTGKLAFPANYCSNMTSLKGSIRSFTFTSDIKASGRVKWPKMLHKTASCSQFTSLISLAKKV